MYVNHRIARRAGFVAAVAASLSAMTVQAQDGVTPQPASALDRVHYDASFYAQFSPRTALDMVNQTPGFALHVPAERQERRGFSGAVSNVLIDGERPSAKRQTLNDILQRIPAAQVLRIEILRGADVAGDASGEAVLLNIVRTWSAGHGVWSTGFEYAGQHKPAPNGWLSWSGRLGRTDYAVGASSYTFARELPGERAVTDGSGQLIERRVDTSPREYYQHAVNGEVARDVFRGRLTITGQAYQSRYHDDSTLVTSSPAGMLLEDEVTPYTERNRTIESGLNFERGFGTWDLSLLALHTSKRFESDVRSTHRDSSSVVDSVVTQRLARDGSESILRTTLVRSSRARRVEAGLEGAFNVLDAEMDLAVDTGGGPVLFDIPNANVSVEERRGEIFGSHTWHVDRWSVETKLAVELSELGFTGDARQSADFVYWKPFVQIARALGARSQAQLRLFRDVGQLDFTDFVSAASVADDVIGGGNPDLRPETSWRAELAADLRLDEKAALTVTAFRYWLNDAVDLVPTDAPGIDAPGNIGPGSVFGVKLNGRMPMGKLMPGATLSGTATLQKAEVTDPFTGRRRTITDFENIDLSAHFRQDGLRQRFAWGIDYERKSSRRKFRRSEIDRQRDSPSLDVFFEAAVTGSLKLRLTVASVLGSPELRDRTFFTPDRAGVVLRTERAQRHPGQEWLLSVSGTL